MRNCFIPGCDQLCKDMPKRRMFCAPREESWRNAWIAVLPTNRTLKPHDKVCERHFTKEDIKTTYDNLIDGLVYKIERGRARLRFQAVPSRNLICETVPSRRAQGKRKAFKTLRNPAAETRNVNPANAVEQENQENHIVHEEQHEVPGEVVEVQEITVDDGCPSAATAPECALPAAEEEHLESIEISEVNGHELFDSLYDDIYEVVLPNTLWGVHRCPERSAVFFSYVDPTALRTTKMITFNSHDHVKILLGNRLLTEQSLADINSVEAFSDVIAQIDEMKLCPRVLDYEFCDVTVKDASEFCTSCLQLD